jgi:hypothetical protein
MPDYDSEAIVSGETLECADNGGALDNLWISALMNPKQRRAPLAATFQIRLRRLLTQRAAGEGAGVGAILDRDFAVYDHELHSD